MLVFLVNIAKRNSVPVKDSSLEVEAEPQKLTSNDNKKDSEDDNREPDSEDVFQDEAENKVTGGEKQCGINDRVFNEVKERLENEEKAIINQSNQIHRASGKAHERVRFSSFEFSCSGGW